jgi:hypothetical protein
MSNPWAVQILPPKQTSNTIKHTTTAKFFCHNILTLGHLAIQETKKSMHEIEFFWGITFLEGRDQFSQLFPPKIGRFGVDLGRRAVGGAGASSRRRKERREGGGGGKLGQLLCRACRAIPLGVTSLSRRVRWRGKPGPSRATLVAAPHISQCDRAVAPPHVAPRRSARRDLWSRRGNKIPDGLILKY